MFLDQKHQDGTNSDISRVSRRLKVSLDQAGKVPEATLLAAHAENVLDQVTEFQLNLVEVGPALIIESVLGNPENRCENVFNSISRSHAAI